MPSCVSTLLDSCTNMPISVSESYVYGHTWEQLAIPGQYLKNGDVCVNGNGCVNENGSKNASE